MSKKLEKLCGHIGRAKKKREEEERLNIGYSYTTIYFRRGCFDCKKNDYKCKHYYQGTRIER